MSKNKLEKMTIFKAKDSVDKFSAIFDLTTESLPNFNYKSGSYEVSGVIKYCEVGGNKKTEQDYPWMSMVNNLSKKFDFKFTTINKTPSAVIGVKIKDEKGNESFFLITFGMHTSRFINKDKLVNDFGIKVAMNICDQNNLKKVNTTTHSAVSKLTDRQASKGASLDIFDIDDEKEFFRSISGLTYKDYPFVKSFSGKNSIIVNIKKDLSVDNDELINILISLDQAYLLDSYKEKFPTYGRLDYVSDNDEIKRLDDLVFEKLKKSDFSGIHLAADTIESDDFSYYAYKDPESSVDVKAFDTIDIEDMIDQYARFNKKSSIDTVRKWRIYAVSTSDEISSMRAYDCLNCELEFNGITYILNSGIWRSIDSDFKLSIEKYIENNIYHREDEYLCNNIPIRHVIRDKGKEQVRYKEEVYNSYVAACNSDIYLFDKSKIIVAGKKQYEICDLLHSGKELIHVKVLKNGSSSLSHLFIQARFYTDAFIKDKDTRSSMREFISTNVNPENEGKDKDRYLSIIPELRDDLHDSSYSVVLCILTFDPNKNLASLPFMARYELAKTHKYLYEERGIKLSYAIRLVTKGE